MARTGQDVTVHRGNDFGIEVSVDPVPTGGIDAYTLEATVRLTADEADPALLTKTTGAGEITINPETKLDDTGTPVTFRFTIVFVDTDTHAAGGIFTPRDYAWDAKRMDAGEEATLASGTLRLLPDVTR